MLVVILGAGASYDSVSPQYQGTLATNRAWRPPVAKDLFEARDLSFGPAMQSFPEGRPLFMRLAADVARGVPVESAIQSVTDAIGGTPYGARQIASLRFYLQQIIWDAGYNWASAAHQLTNYVVLADAIERWRSENNEEVTYITFNYDLILEEALRPFIRFRAFDDYVTGPTKLIKAHGSVDWGHATTMPTKVAGGDLRELLVHEAPERALDAVGWYRFSAYSNSHPAGGRQATSELLYPALALPTTGKAGFECPPDHIEAMEAALAQVSRMLVIGWRAQEQHLLGLLDRVDREVQAQVVTSNAETATTIAAVLSDRMKHLAAQPLGGGFSQFIERGDLDSLLGYDRV